MEAATAMEGGATESYGQEDGQDKGQTTAPTRVHDTANGQEKEKPTPIQKPKPKEGPPEELPRAAEKRKFKVKINGEEKEVDEDTLVRDYQLAQASNQRFEQAKKMYQEAQPYLSAKQKGDLNVLLDGLPDEKKREWAEQYLGEWLKLQQMSPEQREALENKKKIEQYEREREEQRKQKEESERTQRQQALAQKAKNEIESELAEVLQDIPQEKRSPRLVARIAEEMLAHLQARKGRLPAKDAWTRAQKNLQADVVEVLGGMDDERLIQTLPKDLVNRILKYHTNKVKSQSPFGQSKASTKPRSKGEDKRMSTDDFFTRMDKKYQ